MYANVATNITLRRGCHVSFPLHQVHAKDKGDGRQTEKGDAQLCGRQAGNGAQDVEARLVQEDDVVPPEEAAADGDEGGALGGHGGHGRQPEDDGEEVEGQYGPDVVRAAAAGNALRDAGVDDDDPGDDALQHAGISSLLIFGT